MFETARLIDVEPLSTVAKAPSLNLVQISTLFAEIRAIESHAVRAAIIAADNTCGMRARLDQAIASAQISKEFLNELSAQLCLQEKAVVTAITASNLARRLEQDLAPQI